MTLIVTTISELGIVQASDSNLTGTTATGSVMLAGEGKKVFRLGFCEAALALAGDYEIGGVPMDTWMRSTLHAFAVSHPHSLQEFARYLKDRLDVEGTPGKTGLLIHIAGYVSDAQGSHPEMWFVRNFAGIDPDTGGYSARSDRFLISEDFWTRDHPEDVKSGATSQQGYARWYFNGLPEGRISFHALSQMLGRFLQSVWSVPTWSFRAPRDLPESSLFMGLELDVIRTLFEVSDYPVPYVGGRSQVETITPPADAVLL